MIFLVTFIFMLIVIGIMSIGVIFKRQSIKGSCGGGKSQAECICIEKCEKRKKLEAEEQMSEQQVLLHEK